MPEEIKEAEGTKVNTEADETLLKRIREDFSYVKSYWNDNHEEAQKDMNCVACIPPEDFKNDRSGRPCLWPDEISQYVKQSNNNLRQNKRSIKISPRSDEAKDEDAEHRQAYIRGIEYASQAQSIYTSGFESCTECGFGFWRVKLLVTGPKGEQEPRLKRIPNWKTVFPDPDAEEADFSDSNIYFVTDTMRERTFAKRYPKAKKKSFTGADSETAPGWLANNCITVAEYWTREEIDGDDGEKKHKVCQYITNGFEILERNEWIGSWIPIVGVFGEEIYVSSGSESKRMFLSLIRRARPAQQMLAYLASQEAEEFGMAPRAPLQGYKGQFNPETHKFLNKVPMAFIDFEIPNDWNASWGPPPLPTRPQFIPNAQAYEIGFERWRRSLQAAMGLTPLPTAAQRQNEKSGVALERIQTQSAIGSFHFVDNFVRALANTGRQLNELITKLAELDSLPKQILGKDQKDEDKILHVVPSTQEQGEDAESQHLQESDQFFAHRGQFEVTVSDGPNYQSQREEASDFADTMLQVMPKIGLPPALSQSVLSIAVKLKNIGTYGDEIADLLSPPDPNNMPPQAKALLAQSQGQMQQMQQELQKLQMEKLGKVTETQGKLAIVDKQNQAQLAESDKDRETKVLVAEITTKAQDMNQRMDLFMDMMKQWHSQAHDIAMQMQQQNHDKSMAAVQQQNALEQGEQGHAQALEQQDQAGAQQAALAQAQPPQGQQ